MSHQVDFSKKEKLDDPIFEGCDELKDFVERLNDLDKESDGESTE